MKLKLKCNDCGYKDEWEKPTKIGTQRAAKESGWMLWRNAGWSCWPCSEDRKQAAITPEQRAKAKKIFPILNKERSELIHKKFLSGLTTKEDRRFKRLQRQTGDLVEVMQPQINTDHFRKVQNMMTSSRELMRKINKTLNESELKQIEANAKQITEHKA